MRKPRLASNQWDSVEPAIKGKKLDRLAPLNRPAARNRALPHASSSSPDEVDARKKRLRAYGSLDILTRYTCSCARVMYLMPSLQVRTHVIPAQFNCALFTFCCLRLKSRTVFVHHRSFTLGATLEEPSHGGGLKATNLARMFVSLAASCCYILSLGIVLGASISFGLCSLALWLWVS